jgi:hypothetical protein
VTQSVLKTAARHLRTPTALRLQVTLDKRGRVSAAAVETPEKQAKKIEKAVRRLSFKSEGKLAGEPINLSFTVDEVRAQLELKPKPPTKPRTHPNERVPPRRPSHYNEEVADWH